MCARIIQNVDVHALGRVYRVQTDNTEPQIPIRWNGPPGDRYALCRTEGGHRGIARVRWGLVPAWARTGEFAPHNARAETAAIKPTFRDAWKHRRAVLPVNGWYEWRKQPSRSRKPFLIADADGGILHLAALWERWNGPAGPLDSFAVLTTAPRDEVAAIHHRQPAVLETEEDIDDWLDPDAPDNHLMTLAAQAGTRPLRIHEVSVTLNNLTINQTELPL
jgi:putative SOS response-associated peptidase YedK